MKTVYCSTNRYVRREGNVIDFCEYRDRMQRAMAPEGEAAVNSDGIRWVHDAPDWLCEVTPARSEARAKQPLRRKRSFQCADLLELAASAGTLVLVVTVWLQFLL